MKRLTDQKISEVVAKTPSKEEWTGCTSHYWWNWVHIAQAQLASCEQEHREVIEKIFGLYDNYISLLSEEIESMSGIALVHGWKSTRIKQGEYYRKQIESLKASYEEIK